MPPAARGSLGTPTNSPVIDPGTSNRNRTPGAGTYCPTRDSGVLQKLGYVNLAWDLAKYRYAPEAIVRHSEKELYSVVSGFLPGLYTSLKVLAVTTAIGAAAGFVLGEGVGSIPAGAATGCTVGVTILSYLGLAFLTLYIGSHIINVGESILDGTKLAWNSCGDPDTIILAARQIAEGYGLFFEVLIQAIVLYAMEKGFAAALKKLNSSKLGEGFGNWFVKRYSLGGLLKAVDREAGDYAFAQDVLGRPTEAEGWLVKAEGGRDPGAQSLVTEGLEGYQGGHLIPNTYGGPGGARNLVPMPTVTNLSYVKAVENVLGRNLKNGPVYLKVTVEYSGPGKVPSLVRHRFYRMGEEGMEMIPGGDVTTNLGMTPSMPMGKATVPKDFLSPDPTKGVINKLPQ